MHMIVAARSQTQKQQNKIVLNSAPYTSQASALIKNLKVTSLLKPEQYLRFNLSHRFFDLATVYFQEVKMPTFDMMTVMIISPQG